jgi:hypothetical protein
MKIFLMVRKCNCLFFLKNKLRQSVVNYPTNGWAKSKKKKKKHDDFVSRAAGEWRNSSERVIAIIRE